MSAATEDRQLLLLLRLRRRRRRRWPWYGADYLWIAAAVLLLVTSGSADDSDTVNVVYVRTTDRYPPLYHGSPGVCPTACTGVMLTDTLVLTAATCTGSKASDMPDLTTTPSTGNMTTGNTTSGYTKDNAMTSSTTEATATTEKNRKRRKTTDSSVPTTPEERTTKPTTKSFTRIGNVNITVSLRKSSGQNDTRKVTDKYLYPSWNSTTNVGNLAVLKIEKSFRRFLVIIPTFILDKSKKNMYKFLSFRGFGKLNTNEQGTEIKMGISDDLAKRYLKIQYKNASQTMGPDKKIMNDVNWWSFLYVEPYDARVNINSTLCNDDIGGPLYSLEKNGVDKGGGKSAALYLYGIYSNWFHSTYVMCEQETCYTWREGAPFPCNLGENSGTYYRFVAIFGNTAMWLNRFVEKNMQPATSPATRHCPLGESGKTTADPFYDVDHGDRRIMVDNNDLCTKPKSKSTCVACVVAVAVAVAVAAAWLRSS